jgi:hypothetical protein
MNDAMPFPEAVRLLREEAFRRYVEFLRLTVSLSFGGFMFMLAFEKDYLTPSSHWPALVHAAWFLLLASSLGGFFVLAAWTYSPARRLKEAYKRLEAHRPGEEITVPGEMRAIEQWLYWLHLSAFVGAMLSLGVYKMVNL